MAKKVRTARGDIIDFELFKIKEGLSTSTPSVEVKARERFIENKMKRRIKRAKNRMMKDMKDMNDETEVAPAAKSPELVTKKKVSTKPKPKRRIVKKKDST